jgi:CDP-paratose 2-epimerase
MPPARSLVRYLITGGCGFIGSSFAAKLLARGDGAVVLDNLSRKGAVENLEYLRELHPHVEFVQADIVSDTRTLATLMEEVDAVYHLAGQVAVTTSIVDPRHDFQVNALGTLNVLEAIRLSSRRPPILFASTNKVYGSMASTRIVARGKRYEYEDLPEGIAESQPLSFHSPYGCSKGAGDQYVKEYAEMYGLRTVVLRQSCIYGPRQFGVEDQGWVSWFVIAAVLGREIVVYGDGKQVRDLLFIDDLFAVWDRVLERVDRLSGEVYNVGGGPGNVLSLLELVDILTKLVGHPIPVRFEAWRRADQRVYVSNISKLCKELDWEPRVSVATGVQALYTWTCDNRAYFTQPDGLRSGAL